MMHYELAVCSGMNVEFDPVATGRTAGRRCEAERRNGVFEGVAGSAAMADDESMTCCGKLCGRHVDPMLALLKLPYLVGHINNVGNMMWTLFTTDDAQGSRPSIARLGVESTWTFGPGSRRSSGLRLVNETLIPPSVG